MATSGQNDDSAENRSLREIRSFRIFEFKVVRFMPSFPAAVATTPFASRRARKISSLSKASKVGTLVLGTVNTLPLSSVRGTLRTGPCERIRARSTIFSNSRTLPGQMQQDRARIVAGGTLSTRLPIRFACLFTKKLTSKGISPERSRNGGS